MTQKLEKLKVVRGTFPWLAAFKMIKNPVQFLKLHQQITGNLYRIDAPIPFVVITNHEHIRHVLQNNWRNYEKGPAYRGFALMLGNGILNSEGEEWKKNRKMIQPGFNRDHIKGLSEIMTETAKDWCAKWSIATNQNQPIEMKSAMLDFSLDIIARVMMGEECALKYKSRLLPLLQKQYGFVMKRNRSFFNLPLSVPSPSNNRYHRTRSELHTVVYEILDSKKDSDDGTLLAMIMNARDEHGNAMSRDQLRDEFLTLFVTGFETTGNALAWTFLLLAKNPDVQQKLGDEIQNLDSSNIQDLMKAPWLNGVIKETLRLYPSVWIIARRSLGIDSIDGKKIPKKAHIFISNFMAHRDPEFWDEPEEFKPERFIDQKENPSYLPFGVGARMCIGNHFSHMEMLTGLLQFCKNFKIELAEERGFEIDPKITLQPLGNVMVRLIAKL